MIYFNFTQQLHSIKCLLSPYITLFSICQRFEGANIVTSCDRMQFSFQKLEVFIRSLWLVTERGWISKAGEIAEHAQEVPSNKRRGNPAHIAGRIWEMKSQYT